MIQIGRSIVSLAVLLFVCLPGASLSAMAEEACDAALLVIDVQKTFVLGGGWNTTAGEDIVDAVAEILSLARAADVPVIYIKDLSVLMFESVSEPLLEFADGIAPHEDALVFTKNSTSAFMDPDFSRYIASQGIDRLIMCGIASEGCLSATLFGATIKGLNVTIVSDGHSNGPPDPAMDRRTAAEFNAEWAERGIAVAAMDEIDWASFACSP